jgi:ABC-type transporter Mla subunit MlaD
LQTNQDMIVKTLENLNDVVIRIATLFSEENQRNLTAILRNARAGSENLEAISKGTEEIIKEGRLTMKRFSESLNRADDVLSNLQQASKPLAERGPSVMKNLDESVERLNRVLLEVSDLLRAFRQDDGALGKFFRDPSLYNNINEAACMLTRMMPRLDRILKDFEVFADKVARHPESLGLGGVVTPSAGLKEAPSAILAPRH